MHALKEMVLFALRKFEVSLGVVTVERKESMNKRLANRENIEEWRWRSAVIRKTKKIVPKIVIK